LGIKVNTASLDFHSSTGANKKVFWKGGLGENLFFSHFFRFALGNMIRKDFPPEVLIFKTKGWDK